jgi:hypothetical protein
MPLISNVSRLAIECVALVLCLGRCAFVRGHMKRPRKAVLFSLQARSSGVSLCALVTQALRAKNASLAFRQKRLFVEDPVFREAVPCGRRRPNQEYKCKLPSQHFRFVHRSLDWQFGWRRPRYANSRLSSTLKCNTPRTAEDFRRCSKS